MEAIKDELMAVHADIDAKIQVYHILVPHMHYLQ